MQIRYGLYSIILLSAGCNFLHSATVPDKLKSQEIEKPITAKEKFDAGVEIILLTEQAAKEMGLMAVYQTDPGFAKWCVFFHEIPGSPPYTFQQQRLLQPLPDRFYPCQGPSSDKVLECKNRKMPTGIVVSARGYLPGEKIKIRLSAKDTHREAVLYPLPLHLKKKSGELLAKVALLCAQPGFTLYDLDICGIGKQEKYKFVSHSGDEIISHDLQGPISCTLTPEVVGFAKGIGKMELQFEDGTSYSMELPWGDELLEYAQGNK